MKLLHLGVNAEMKTLAETLQVERVLTLRRTLFLLENDIR